MSRAAEAILPFAGEDRLFRLPLGRVRAVQEACDAGPPELLSRYAASTWRVDDLRAPILHGLIGGGMEQRAAQGLVERSFDPEPKLQFVPIAQAVILAFLIGAPDGEEPGEPEAAGVTAKSPFREESSASPGSTEPDKSSD